MLNEIIHVMNLLQYLAFSSKEVLAIIILIFSTSGLKVYHSSQTPELLQWPGPQSSQYCQLLRHLELWGFYANRTGGAVCGFPDIFQTSMQIGFEHPA